MNSIATGKRREMPPHGATNEAFKVSPSSDDTPIEKPRSGRLAMLQKGLNKEKLGKLKHKLQTGSNNISNKLFHSKSSDDSLDGSKHSQGTDGPKGYSKNQVVWYKSQGKKPQQAKILCIEMDDGHPFYTIKLIKSGREKQTDDAHLEPLGPNDVTDGNSQGRFKTGQIVFHKPSDGSPIYLTQIINVYQGDGQTLYDIKLQGSNVEKSAIKESELLDMHEVGGTAPAPAQPKAARNSRHRSRSPVRGIKKVLSSEGLKEMKRGVKKIRSMEGLEQMKKSLRGKSRDKSRDRAARATPVRAVPLTKSGLSSHDGSSEFSREASARSLRSNEGGRVRGSRKKSRSMEGLREMTQATATGSNSSMDGGRVKPRSRIQKTRSMEGMREMMQTSKSAHPPPVRRPPQPSMSMSSHQRSVRSHRPPPRSSTERNKLDRERGVQRSKSLEGMHPKHLRRPSRERLGGPQNWQSKDQSDHGPARPPPRTTSAAQRRGTPLSTSLHGPPGGRPARRVPTRKGSTESNNRTKSPTRSTGNLRRPVPPPPHQGISSPPIRAVKKPANDSDSEESSISSVSWQDKPRSFNRPQPPLPKRDPPKPTEITVDADDASSVSSEDSSWESFRERPSFRPNNIHEQWQQRRDAKKASPRHLPKVVGKDCVSGAELVLETVYSSDEESEHPTNLPADFEPEDLFDWRH